MTEANQAQMNDGKSSRAVLEARIIAHAWKDSDFKQQLFSNPRAAIESFLEEPIPSNIEIKVVEESANTLYLVLPPQPVSEAELSEDQLAAIAGGGGGIEILWTGFCVNIC
jgi:hypothetical protein